MLLTVHTPLPLQVVADSQVSSQVVGSAQLGGLVPELQAQVPSLWQPPLPLQVVDASQ